MNTSKTADDFNPEISFYCTAFLDVLGQRDLLRGLVRLPDSAEEMEAIAPVVRDSIGFVHDLREGMKVFYSQFSKPAHVPEDLTPEQLVQFENLRKNELITSGFGDALIGSVKLTPAHGWAQTMNSVFVLLGSAVMTMIMALRMGHLIRGGIDVGLGAIIEDHEVYGANLVRAYDLESKCAAQPRVLIGEELQQFVGAAKRGELQGEVSPSARSMAVLCERQFFQDKDGVVALDFLGEGVREVMGGGLDRDHLRKAYEFANAEYARHLEAGDHKLAGRLQALVSYMESRLPLWGVTLGTDDE